jgi:hypothetical protein
MSHILVSNNQIDPSHCNQPQHIFGYKLNSRVSYCDFSSMMNRDFDDSDYINEAHSEEPCAQTFAGKGDSRVGVACNTNSFELSRGRSYDGGAMVRRNGEAISEAGRKLSTPFRHSNTPDLDPNLVANDKSLMEGYLNSKADTFNHGAEDSSDDEDSFESIFKETFEPEPIFLSGSKRSHEDSFLSLLQGFKISSRRNSSTCSLTGLTDQIGCTDNENGSFEEKKKAKALFQNSRVLVPLVTGSGDDFGPSSCAKRAKLDCAQDKSPGTVDSLKRSICGYMKKSAQTMKALQEWDRKNGLPKSHSQTMVNSSRSREQLQSGMVLQKWNGVPLLLLPGAKVKVIRRKFRGVKVAELGE